MQVAVGVSKREHECGCVVVSGHADDDAIRGALALDLNPISSSEAIPSIGSLGDDPFDRRNTRKPVVRQVQVVGLQHELEAWMQPIHQIRQLTSPLIERAVDQAVATQLERVEHDQDGWATDRSICNALGCHGQSRLERPKVGLTVFIHDDQLAVEQGRGW